MSLSSTTYVRGIAPDPVNREVDDYYPTPPAGTEALLRVESFAGRVWEPACGAGDIAKVLAAHDCCVIATDLVDRGYGRAGVDFLTAEMPAVDAIVTNPPFKLAEAFALRALARAPKVALLLRLSWLEGINRRRDIFLPHPPARVWVFSGRLPMQRGRLPRPGERGGMIAFAWFVWDRAHQGPTQLGWI